ncbi:NARE ribosyltransferase, partial [Cisticola juncidis]|nr:NARE ribosyltransferase [Cisticola juncidis]
LLAMAVAAVANDVERLDMARDSFDDRYEGCGPAMAEELPVLNASEFLKNQPFAQAWLKAAAKWQRRGPPESPLSPEQATAVMAFTTDGLHREFNAAVRMAGRSAQQYRDNFHFKTLHFLLTQALQKLRDALGQKCYELLENVCGTRFVAKRGDTVRFGQFMSLTGRETPGDCPGKQTLFHVYTCHGVDIAFFAQHGGDWGVLIPPYETFQVVEDNEAGDKAVIQLHSTGTHSKYNCEWLKGDSTGDSLG